MQTETIHQTTTVWRSQHRPVVATDDPALAEVIAWADANPQAWKIVTTLKSRAFGIGSSEYIGWAQRGLSPDAILERLRHLREYATGRPAHLGSSHLYVWRAKFTVDHFDAPGFTGGFFRQHDERYERLCMTLDYTPETLEEVTDRFLHWCGRDYVTTRVTVDSRVVRRMGGSAHGRCE